MVVRNTPGELNKIEQRIRDAQGERAQKQFEVETKFLQFSDNDVKNFTFNLQMATGSTVYGTGAPGLSLFLVPLVELTACGGRRD